MQFKAKYIKLLILAIAIGGLFISVGCSKGISKAQPPDVKLIDAVAQNDISNVKNVLVAGAVVNMVIAGRHGTALIVAIKNGNSDIVKLLLDYKAKVNLPNQDGETPLLFATYKGDAAIVKVLLESGANPNIARKRFKIAPLHVAAARGDSAIIKLLLTHKANVNIAGEAGVVALRITREFDHQEAEELLIKAGAK